MCLFCSLCCTVDLEAIIFAEQVLADVLDGVLRFVLCELLEGLKKSRHDVLVEVLTNGQVRVHGLFLFASLAASIALIVTGVASGVVYYNTKSQIWSAQDGNESVKFSATSL